jgi:hypothetical protein
VLVFVIAGFRFDVATVNVTFAGVIKNIAGAKFDVVGAAVNVAASKIFVR